MIDYALGFTGSRTDRPSEQVDALDRVFKMLFANGYRTFHHGDCVGADWQAWLRATQYFRIVCHPPDDDRLRAFLAAAETRESKPYLVRNRDIVDETHALVGCPRDDVRGRSGTWYTIDYAISRDRPTYIVWPDGTTELRRNRNEE